MDKEELNLLLADPMEWFTKRKDRRDYQIEDLNIDFQQRMMDIQVDFQEDLRDAQHELEMRGVLDQDPPSSVSGLLLSWWTARKP